MSEAQPAFDRSTARLLAKGHVFEDFTTGRVFEHHWGRTLSLADNTLFTTTTLAFNPLYFNSEYAQAHDHPDVVINPMLVLCVVIGLSVEDLSEGGGPFLGLTDLNFLQPVYPGDTVTARSTVVSARASRGRPAYGIVTWWSEGLNQRSEPVITYRRSNLVIRRNRGDSDG